MKIIYILIVLCYLELSAGSNQSKQLSTQKTDGNSLESLPMHKKSLSLVPASTRGESSFAFSQPVQNISRPLSPYLVSSVRARISESKSVDNSVEDSFSFDEVEKTLAIAHESVRKSLSQLEGLPEIHSIALAKETKKEEGVSTILTSSQSALVPYKKTNERDTVLPLGKKNLLMGVLRPYCAYRFDTTRVRRPITSVTSGSYVLYSALAVKDLWQKKWSKEPDMQGLESLDMQELDRESSALVIRLIQEKSALVQTQVKEMVERYGEQEGEQVYLTDGSLREMLSKNFFENKDPFKNVFMFSQEKKYEFIPPSFHEWQMYEEVVGQEKELQSFLNDCIYAKKEACACVIGTFVKPFHTYDRVAAVICKKAGQQGPVFIYIDPLNRGMKKNPRARLFVTFLLKQAIASRSRPKEEGLFGRLLQMLPTLYS